eukprot:UN04014
MLFPWYVPVCICQLYLIDINVVCLCLIQTKSHDVIFDTLYILFRLW